MSFDPLGDRMKSNYEDRWRIKLPRRTYTIIRVDGQSFHSFTKDMDKPFDSKLLAAMFNATVYCSNAFQGCAFAYGQSDEVSFLLTDFAYHETEAYFDNNMQKLCSIAASTFTAAFNSSMPVVRGRGLATFDARVFQISDPVEVANYFLWRQRDAIRNSVLGVAQSLFSQRELKYATLPKLKEMIASKGLNWDKIHPLHQRGWLYAFNDEYKSNEENRYDYMAAPLFSSKPDGELNCLIPRPTYKSKKEVDV